MIERAAKIICAHIASAIEAGTGETPKSGSISEADESAPGRPTASGD